MVKPYKHGTLDSLVDLDYSDLVKRFQVTLDDGTHVEVTDFAGNTAHHERRAAGIVVSPAQSLQDETTIEKTSDGTITLVPTGAPNDPVVTTHTESDQPLVPCQNTTDEHAGAANESLAQSPSQATGKLQLPSVSSERLPRSRSRTSTTSSSEELGFISTVDFPYQVEAVLDLSLSTVKIEKETLQELTDGHSREVHSISRSAPPRYGFVSDLFYNQLLTGANAVFNRAAMAKQQVNHWSLCEVQHGHVQRFTDLLNNFSVISKVYGFDLAASVVYWALGGNSDLTLIEMTAYVYRQEPAEEAKQRSEEPEPECLTDL
ncbi:hypothetical protein LTR95_010561 [Oleoguttula sp. CCFEE 5521]